MEVQDLTLDQIKPYDHNPRDNDGAVDAVAASIKNFGFKVPIIIDKDQTIVAGHTRFKAAKKLGLQSVPCILADDLTEEQVRAFRLADNKVGELAGWDFDMLDEELRQIMDINMEQFGFEVPEPEAEITEDDYEVVLPENPKSRLGDVYLLGEHRLMVGDSTSPEDVKVLMGGVEANILLTDPPYNIDYTGKTKDAMKIDNDAWSDDSEFVEFLRKAFFNALEALKPGGAFYVWYAPTQTTNFLRGAAEAGMNIRQQIIWVKNIFSLGRQDYQWRHEPCLYGWKDGAGHYFINDRTQSTVQDFTPDFSSMKKTELVDLLDKIYGESTVIYENKPSRSALHPTMKPVELYAGQIKNSTKPGEIVLDIFGGSGTAIIAAQQLGRRAFVMEYDPHYADVIIDRWEQFTGEEAVLLSGG